VTERSGDRPIGRYEYFRYDDPSDVFRPWDERAPEVARRVGELIRARMTDAVVEHVGSSAVPGCHGKGVVDLMLLYPPGRLAAARDALDGLGFQRQQGIDPFPEERPLRVGTYDYDGDTFKLHVHVISSASPEAEELLSFRDRLRADPGLVEAYVANKRAVLEAGVPDNIAYNAGKQSFIQGVIQAAGGESGNQAPQPDPAR
jgi:GrpB-like predicted nucleotidyltransferase (UPF0157 family)